jgi:hypothetical protein
MIYRVTTMVVEGASHALAGEEREHHARITSYRPRPVSESTRPDHAVRGGVLA